MVSSSAYAVTELISPDSTIAAISSSKRSAEAIMASGSVPFTITIILSFTATFANEALFLSSSLPKKLVIFSWNVICDAIMPHIATVATSTT